MTNDDFLKIAREAIVKIADTYALSDDKAFVMFCAASVFAIDEDDAFEGALVGGKNDLGLDFGLIDDPNSEILLAQGKYSSSLTRDEIRNFEEVPAILVDGKKVRELRANDVVVEFSRKYRRALNKGYKLRPYFFHWDKLSQALEREFSKSQYCGFRQIKSIFEESQSIAFAKRPAKIELELMHSDQYFKLPDMPGKPRCVVGTLSLRTLWDLYETHKSGLFDDNVRLHAGDKTAANKSMQETLTGDGGTEAPNFFFYNNGISILCDGFKPKKSKSKKMQPSNKRCFVLDRPQIINGAQTTYTVGKLDQEDIPQTATVLVRILCPPKNSPKAFKDKVIRCNNTQTPVTSRDFRSNDPIQKELFESLQKWTPPYFYERKVGLWDSLPLRDKSKFKKKGKGTARSTYRIIENGLLAQCILAWDGKPGAAKNDKRRIFVLKSENGIYDDVFPPDCYKPEKCTHYVLAYELNNRFLTQRYEWSLQMRREINNGDEDNIKTLEKDRFLTHLNFFGVASIGYIYRKFIAAHCSDCKVLLEQGYFDDLFKFVKSVFGSQLRAEQRAAEGGGRIFNMNNWFKNDSNFENSICVEIAERSAEIPTPN